MTPAIVSYSERSATSDQIRVHLEHCDQSYQPPLSQRVHIGDYATKIAGNAETFEAWVDGHLVGLVATYFSVDSGSGFVTSVSVDNDFTGHGIATALLTRCIERARSLRMGSIALEVFRGNNQAIRLYTKHGFVESSTEYDLMHMHLSLCGQENQ